MWLFDNIFLDKDTPTALLENPEIKPPEWEKKTEAAQAYDPKNDPIAPAADTNAPTATTGGSDVSFDIWGDLDFSSLGGSEASPTNQGEAKTDKPSESTESTTNTASIALVQGGTASAIENIDIWGDVGTLEGIKVDIPGEWEKVTPLENTTSNPESTWQGSVDIHIHDIEEHTETPSETATGDTSGASTDAGILGMIWGEASAPSTVVNTSEASAPSETVDASMVFNLGDLWKDTSPTENILQTTPESEWSKETTEAVNLFSEVVSAPVVHTESVTTESHFDLSNLQAGWGRIQELIGKLIEELKRLDEAEKKAIQEREEKIRDIDMRAKALDTEYETRKKALEYERNSIHLPLEENAEKDRIKSLIASFEKDLDTV